MLSQGRNAPSMFLRDTQELFVELDAAGVVSGKGRLLQLLVPKETSLFQRMRIKDDAFLHFLSQLLQVDPAFRITAKEALSHPWLCEGKYPDGL
jgi:serine/threonine protein kinase